MADFTGQNIQDTYQRVVQIDGGRLEDGLGNALPISMSGNDVVIDGTLRAQSYIVTESITIQTTGSTLFGDDDADNHKFLGSITASGNISASGNGIFSKVNTGEGLTEVHLMNQNLRQIDGVVFGSVETTGNTGFGNAITDTHTLEGHITASHNISSSGTVESNGLILTSPDGTRYQISVNNAGTLSTTAI